MTCMFELIGFTSSMETKVLEAVKGLSSVTDAHIVPAAVGPSVILHVQTAVSCDELLSEVAQALAPLGIAVQRVVTSTSKPKV